MVLEKNDSELTQVSLFVAFNYHCRCSNFSEQINKVPVTWHAVIEKKVIECKLQKLVFLIHCYIARAWHIVVTQFTVLTLKESR